MFVEVWIEKGAGKHLLFEKGLINFVFSQNRSPYERMDSDLVDSSWKAFCSMKDGLNSIVGKQFSGSLSSFKVEVDVIYGIIESKTDQIMGICDTLSQRFVLRVGLYSTIYSTRQRQ